jgi:hypothetical protein
MRKSKHRYRVWNASTFNEDRNKNYTSSDILDGTPIKVNKTLLLACNYKPTEEGDQQQPKVMLSLCLIKHYIVKTYRGVEE